MEGGMKRGRKICHLCASGLQLVVLLKHDDTNKRKRMYFISWAKTNITNGTFWLKIMLVVWSFAHRKVVRVALYPSFSFVQSACLIIN